MQLIVRSVLSISIYMYQAICVHRNVLLAISRTQLSQLIIIIVLYVLRAVKHVQVGISLPANHASTSQIAATTQIYTLNIRDMIGVP